MASNILNHFPPGQLGQNGPKEYPGIAGDTGPGPSIILNDVGNYRQMPPAIINRYQVYYTVRQMDLRFVNSMEVAYYSIEGHDVIMSDVIRVAKRSIAQNVNLNDGITEKDIKIINLVKLI